MPAVYPWIMPTFFALGLAAAAMATSPEATTERMEFLGFSSNDRSCAWLLTLVSPNEAGGVDRYQLVQLVDIANNRLVGNFRGPQALHRLDARGQRLATARRSLEASHPDWSHAASYALWRKTRRDGRFAHKQVDFKSALVRLVPDEDSRFALSVDERSKTLEITRQQGALGFTPVASLLDGGLLPLGHFRLAGHEGVGRAELRVYHSKSGRRVAAVAAFGAAHQPPVQVGGAVFFTADANPLGTTATGSLELIEQQSQSVEHIFKSMHPGRGRDWDLYVGRWF